MNRRGCLLKLLPGWRRRGLAALLLAAIAAVWGAGISSARADRLRRWARELARLRSRISLANGALKSERTRGLLKLKSLESRRGELRMQLDAAGLRLGAIRLKLSRQRRKFKARKGKSAVLIPVVSANIVKLKSLVKAGLPFKREARLKSLEELAVKLKSGRVAPESAASRLWRFIEDELKLCSEVALDEIAISLGEKASGKRRLVPVVRLGMVTLFTRLGPKSYGRIFRGRDGRWRHVSIVDKGHGAQVALLFKNLGKQIREGVYGLPLPEVEVGAGTRRGTGTSTGTSTGTKEGGR